MMEKNEYIEDELSEIETLKENLKNLKAKWFKNSKIEEKIQFLEYYILEKERMINNLRNKNIEN